MQEEIEGKTVTTCDNCFSPLVKELDLAGENLKAEFPTKQGKSIDRAFCNFECLRVFLNKKAKLTRRSKAAEFLNGVWSLDFSPIQFTQSKLWE